MKSWIEISAARLATNFAAIGDAAGPEFEVLAVIKADAYGHGAALCAPVLVEAGARWLGVGDLEEGLRVRAALRVAGLDIEAVHVVTMCGFEPEDAPGIVEAGLTPVVWTAAHVESLERAAAALERRVPVHFEIDTGMARQGAAPEAELGGVLQSLRRSKHVRCEGVFSHLSSAEVVGSVETVKQVQQFQRALNQVFDAEVMPEYIHLGNSSAVDEGSTVNWVREFATGQMSATPLVRTGLALYGYTLPLTGDVDEERLRPGLEPVATWKTRVVGVRGVVSGETVGYGATFVVDASMRLALLPVGYADGFRREASSGVGDGWVTIRGRRAPVVGRVSMNLTVVDVTEFEPAVETGEEVELLGPGVTAEDHARWCGTIPYEILCGMRGHRRVV